MTFVAGYYTQLREATAGSVTDIKPNYMAWGNSTAAESSTFTALGNELGRQQVTSYLDVNTDAQRIITYLGPSVANTTVKELGWFIGATSTAGSGTLMKRDKVSWTKTSLESRQEQLTAQFKST